MTLDKTELLFQKMLIQGPCEAVEGPGRLSRRLSGKLGWEVLGAWISGCLWLTVGILRRQGLNSEGGGEGRAIAESKSSGGGASQGKEEFIHQTFMWSSEGCISLWKLSVWGKKKAQM